jgi:hypothetical protein
MELVPIAEAPPSLARFRVQRYAFFLRFVASRREIFQILQIYPLFCLSMSKIEQAEYRAKLCLSFVEAPPIFEAKPQRTLFSHRGF